MVFNFLSQDRPDASRWSRMPPDASQASRWLQMPPRSLPDASQMPPDPSQMDGTRCPRSCIVCRPHCTCLVPRQHMYGVHTAHVWCPRSTCLVSTQHMFGVHTAHVWCPHSTCMVSTQHMYCVHTAHLWSLNTVCSGGKRHTNTSIWTRLGSPCIATGSYSIRTKPRASGTF